MSTTEDRFGGNFMDLRVGLFMVDTVTAHVLSKGWSLLKWKRMTNFCSNCGQPLGMTEKKINIQ